MISSIMASTTQDQQKNTAETTAPNEEIHMSQENGESQEATDEHKVNEEIENNGQHENVEEVNGNEKDEIEGCDDVDENDVEDKDDVSVEDGQGEGEGEWEGERVVDGAVDADIDCEAEAEGDDVEADDEEQVPETKVEKQLDHDQDRRNPQYIPKGGAFYEHDNRTSLEDVENKDPQDLDKKKKVWKESKETERWLHDWYKESEQQPKTKAEIMETYGYDIRNEEAPPRARRRRKYGRGPDKYDRNWEDEQAYMMKQNPAGRRGKKKSFGKDEFPPLPNRKSESSAEKIPPKSPGWKKDEEFVKKSQKVNNHEKTSGSSQINRNDHSGTRNGVNSVNSNKRNVGQNKNVIKEEAKSYRQFDKTKWKNNTFRRGKSEEVLKSNKLKAANQGESQTPRSVDSNKSYTGDSDSVAHIAEGFGQMTFHNKNSSMRDNRQDSNEINEQELNSPPNRLNPKRYSKNRKGFTGFFPPEEIVEIDPVEMKQLQQEQQQKNQHVNLQQQPLNIHSVIRRYPGTYNGNPGYIAPRQILTGMPQQGMSPQGLQQALSPQGIPQQALSPQVPGLQTIELQQGPMPPHPSFVPSLYIDPNYSRSEMMGSFTSYAPYSANQPGEMYQPSGTTYYNTECQNSNQIRAPPARRQKAAIPILPPPE